MSESNCAVCGAAYVNPSQVCQTCHAPSEWADLFRAAAETRRRFANLHQQGLLSEAEVRRTHDLLASMHVTWSEQARQGLQPPGDRGLPSPLHCRQCERPANTTQNFCAICGGPTGARADRLRYLDFALNLVAGPMMSEIAPDHAARCAASLRTAVRDIEAELRGQAEARVAVAEESTVVSESGRRTLVEILLDPQSIRWLLVSGGVLLAVGLVIFLSSLGVFENATVVASTMGVGTLAVLAGGIAMIRLTRHSLAGRAMALLGCLVMPLNLWFYNANQLVTLDGHLWLAAMACCVLYAAAAVVLKDPLFVYVLFGGIAMTGMLALADLHRLIEVSAPAAMLISLGLVSLHVERAFADDDGPFSRKRFGLACFRSAHAMIGLGLLLLLGSHIAGWMPNVGFGLNHLAALPHNSWLALGLVLAGGYAYTYSSLVVRRQAVFGYAAVLCLLWAQLLGIRIGHLDRHLPVLMSALALTALAINITTAFVSRKADSKTEPFAGVLSPLGVGLIGIALTLGVLPYLGTSFPGVAEHFDLAVTWSYVGAMALVAASARVAASVNARRDERLSIAYHAAASGATFLTVIGLLTILGISTWPIGATVLMVIPMLYLVASRLHKDGPAKQTLPLIASFATIGLTIWCGIATAGQWLHPASRQTASLWLAAFLLEAALFFAVSAAMRRRQHNVYLAAAMVCGMLYQLVGLVALPLQSYNIALAVAGVVGLLVHRILNVGRDRKGRQVDAMARCANALVSLPMAGVMLLCLSRLATGQMQLSMLWTPAALSGLALAAAIISVGGARRWYAALTISQVVLGLVTLAQYSTLGLTRKLELCSVLAGMALLVGGYVVWYRTQNGKSEGVGLSLLAGALLAGLPPAGFALVNRFGFEVSFVDELTLVTIAVLMFLTGMMTRVRATTLVGGGLLVCHLVTLIVFTGMKAQLAVGAYLSIGGAALFGVGVVLSINRDRLLAMPQRIKQRQGLFRVLAWT